MDGIDRGGGCFLNRNRMKSENIRLWVTKS